MPDDDWALGQNEVDVRNEARNPLNAMPTVSARLNETDEWLRLFASRDEVADAYAQMLHMHPPTWPHWRAVNGAILRRWSPNALRYIKTKAWKIAGHQAEDESATPDAE